MRDLIRLAWQVETRVRYPLSRWHGFEPMDAIERGKFTLNPWSIHRRIFS